MNDDAHSRTDPRHSIESALNLLGGSSRSIQTKPPSSTLRGNQAEIIEQFTILAGSDEIAIFDCGRLSTRLDGGGEHDVFLARNSSPDGAWRVYKKTHLNHAGQTARAVKRIDGIVRVASDDATPAEYFDRMILHNQIFGDDIRFEGLCIDGSRKSLIISQPYIKGDIPSREDADHFLAISGFSQKADGFWYSANRGVGIVDTKPANFIQTSDHGIHPIDLVIFIPTKSMLEVWSA